MRTWRPSAVALAVAVVVMAALTACKSPEQIQAEQDEADDQRCAGMGVPMVAGDPGYIQCRMWAAQMRLQEDEDRRQNFLMALQAFAALQRQRQVQFYEEPPEPWPQAQWLEPAWITPPPPQPSWCRPIGRWMSCTGP
jgi:hypothetical protein